MFIKTGNTRTYSEVDVVQQTINKANSVNLLDIFNIYDININIYSRKINCPFPFHKNGQEKSASFYHYNDNNSFYCFGCKTGGKPVDFISMYEGISRYSAALAIINNFDTYEIENVENNIVNYSKIYLEFSHLIRSFIIKNKDNEKAIIYAEYICSAFDSVRSKYVLDPNGLNIIFSKLKRKLEEFK